jgi:hypothetical protein
MKSSLLHFLVALVASCSARSANKIEFADHTLKTLGSISSFAWESFSSCHHDILFYAICKDQSFVKFRDLHLFFHKVNDSTRLAEQ